MTLQHSPGDEDSEDIFFSPGWKYRIPLRDGKRQERVTCRRGCTRQAEALDSHPEEGCEESGRSRVCVCWSHVPEEITLGGGATKSVYKFLMTVDRDSLVAQQEMRNGTWWYWVRLCKIIIIIVRGIYIAVLTSYSRRGRAPVIWTAASSVALCCCL